jgi:hypothetical protein
MNIIDFKAVRKNSLRGFFTLVVADSLHIRDCALHQANGKAWFSFPGAAQIDSSGQAMRKDDGKVIYKNLIQVPDRALFDKVQAKVLAELASHLDRE